MSAFMISRSLLRRHALATGISLSVGSALVLRQPKIRMDARAVPRPMTTGVGASGSKERLDPEVIRQLSSGSVTGFLAGLVISVFSRTLVLLFGVTVVIIQVAARYGINVIDQLRVKERLGNSRVLRALEKDPAFKLSFGFFFAMSAFIRFRDL
ncbi:hypothetical protein BX600DRAFT_515907 [Xylariales sp. PMI_506]|nr:hypothetical protein BX600DRAFT_515907 [Xylariales sp. PMI_506]